MRYDKRESKQKFDNGKSNFYKMFNLIKKGIPSSAHSKHIKRTK